METVYDMKKTYSQFLYEASPPYDYSSILVDLGSDPTFLKYFFKDLVQKINPEDLAENGIEQNPHITVVYGLTQTDEYEETRGIIKSSGINKINITPLSINYFSPSKSSNSYYPLVIHIHSPELIKLRNLILDNFENEQTFADYKPHITIAYLKQKPDKYIQKTIDLEPFVINEIVYSNKMGYLRKIKL